MAAVPGKGERRRGVEASIVGTMPHNVLAKFVGFVREKEAISRK